jgi:hypothetical protein
MYSYITILEQAFFFVYWVVFPIYFAGPTSKKLDGCAELVRYVEAALG